jgi:hypothetical protein
VRGSGRKNGGRGLGVSVVCTCVLECKQSVEKGSTKQRLSKQRRRANARRRSTTVIQDAQNTKYIDSPRTTYTHTHAHTHIYIQVRTHKISIYQRVHIDNIIPYTHVYTCVNVT